MSTLAIWDNLIGELATAENNLLLRDFHSPNIIWRENEIGIAQRRTDRFPDAMIGPTAMIASMTQDARVTIAAGSLPAIDGRLPGAAQSAGRIRRSPFPEDLGNHVGAAQLRKLAGLWVRLMQRTESLAT